MKKSHTGKLDNDVNTILHEEDVKYNKLINELMVAKYFSLIKSFTQLTQFFVYSELDLLLTCWIEKSFLSLNDEEIFQKDYKTLKK